MAPNPDDVKVAIEALRTAAKEWDKASDELRHIAAEMASLEIRKVHMGLAAPIAKPYEETRDGLEVLLLEASEQAYNISDALKFAANSYQKDEEEGIHRLKSIW